MFSVLKSAPTFAASGREISPENNFVVAEAPALRVRKPMKLDVTAVRYILVAAFGYAVDLGGFCLLLKTSMGPVKANILIKIVAVIAGFLLHRRFTFSISDSRGMAAQALKYFSLAAVCAPASTLVLAGILFFMKSAVLAKFLADVILVVITYTITKSFVFTPPATLGARLDQRGGG